MKIVLQGIRGSGKTSLRRRLAGVAFRSAYKATSDTEITSIEWSLHFDHQQPAEVEIWEVSNYPHTTGQRMSKKTVDEHLTKNVTSMHNVKHARTQAPSSTSSISVYNGAHGVVFMVDPNRLSSLKFVLDHCASIPSNMPVAVLINFFDQQSCNDRRGRSQAQNNEEHHKKALTHNEIEQSIMVALPHQNQRLCLRCVECSMANCFGLTALYDYFAIPYLHMRLSTQAMQAEVTRAQWQSVCFTASAEAPGQ